MRCADFANALTSLGVERGGDRAAIYMGMVPELPRGDARLRPDRGGSLGGVSVGSPPTHSPTDRDDGQAKVLVTQDAHGTVGTLSR